MLTSDSNGDDYEEIDVEELCSVSNNQSSEVYEEHTWKSPRDDAKEYNSVIVVNCIRE